MADVLMWLGENGVDTASIICRSDTAGTLTVSGASASPVNVDPSTEYGIGRLNLTGLPIDSRVVVGVYLDMVHVGDITVQTLPSTKVFNVAWGTCLKQLRVQNYGYQIVLDWDARAFWALGDTPYADEAIGASAVNGRDTCRWQLGAAIPSVYTAWSTGRVAWDKQYEYLQRTPGWEYLTQHVPLYRGPDDHEYGDDWDWNYTNNKNSALFSPTLTSASDAATCGGYANAAQWSWNKGNPEPIAASGWTPSAVSDSVANHPAKFYVKRIGHAEFFHLDIMAHTDSWQKSDRSMMVCVNRSDVTALGYVYSDPSGAALAKTALGPHQLNALLDWLSTSTADFKIIMSGKMTTHLNAPVTIHGWDQFPTEIKMIKQFIARYATGVLWCVGDAHMPSLINDASQQHACVNSSPLGQNDYLLSAADGFYRAGLTDGCVYRAEGPDNGMLGSLNLGSEIKRTAFGVLRFGDGYVNPILVDENGSVLYDCGYLTPDANVLLPSLSWRSGEWA